MPDHPIDQMLQRRLAFLRDIKRSGNIDTWSHLKTHGHHPATRDACLRLGLIAGTKQRFELTEAGQKSIWRLETAF